MAASGLVSGQTGILIGVGNFVLDTQLDSRTVPVRREKMETSKIVNYVVCVGTRICVAVLFQIPRTQGISRRIQ